MGEKLIADKGEDLGEKCEEGKKIRGLMETGYLSIEKVEEFLDHT